MKGVLAVWVGLLLSVAGLATAGAGVQPYGADDAGGFRNVLPPGEAGVDNAADLVRFEALGTLPPHWADQQPLYEGLLYASPTMTHARSASWARRSAASSPRS